MSQADFWYVRFPDGRILRAANTPLLRQELSAGKIPPGSTVRRSPQDEWVSLEWTQEFSDLIDELASRTRTPAPPTRNRNATTRATAPNHAATVGSRLESSRLHLVGVRGYLDELLAALDTTLVAKKLLIGVVAGLLFGGLLALRREVWFQEDSRWRATEWTLIIGGVVLFDFLTGLLTRLTFIELARLRPARWSEGFARLGALTTWIVVSQLIVGGSAWGLIVLLRWLPFWIGSEIPGLAGAALVVGMILEALIWPTFFFWWLIPPLLVVEDCSVWGGLVRWCTLLRRHWGRVFTYQTMAVGMGVVLTAPFLLLLMPLFSPSFYPPDPLQNVVQGTRLVLLGLACAPMLSYGVTANVFIYLNLRYGGASGR